MTERTQTTETRTSDLQETELGQKISEINNVIEPYSKPILFGIVLVAAAVIGLVLYRSGETSKRSQATLELIEAVGEGDPERLQRVVGTFPDTVAAGWAAVFRGDETLASGVNQLYQDREAGLAEIETAQAAYKQARSIGGDALLISRANFGLAKSLEAVGDAEAAIAAYREVVAANESEQMQKYAEGRIAILEKPQTQEFLAWFNEQDFSPADPSLPPSLPGMGSLPGLPDLDLPELTLSSGEDDADADASETTEASTSEDTTTEDTAEPETTAEESEETETDSAAVNE